MLAPLGNFRFNENFLFNLYYAVLSMQRSSSDIIFSSFSLSTVRSNFFFLLIRLSRLVLCIVSRLLATGFFYH